MVEDHYLIKKKIAFTELEWTTIYGYTNITSDVPNSYECKAADKFCYKISLKANKTTEVMGLSYRLSNSISND